MKVLKKNGTSENFDPKKIKRIIEWQYNSKFTISHFFSLRKMLDWMKKPKR